MNRNFVIKINLHNTDKSISAFSGLMDMILLASHLYRALLSLASAVKV